MPGRFSFIFFWLVYLVFSADARAQKNYTISGTIKDATTGETLIGATVNLQQLKQNGVVTNAYGFFSLTAPAGNYNLIISYVGYQNTIRPVVLDKNISLTILLSGGNNLNEVTISGSANKNENVEGAQMGVNRLDLGQINHVPVIFGEKDVLKTIQLLPGVKTTGDGNTGFYVRGGGADHNLILLDEAVVYNASHLFGFFSTFNADAIKDVSLYKGGMPAQYGGRMASVLDIKMLDGNNQQFAAQGGIGLIASRLKLEGPIVKNKGSFMVSARRTYADMFLKLSPDSTTRSASLYFYDLNAKVNYRFNDKNAIYASGYFGKDVLGLKDNFETNWGNQTATLRFNHIFSSKLFSNTSFIYSNYYYIVQNYVTSNDFKVYSKIRDFNVKEDLQYYFSDRNTLLFGVNFLTHSITPGDITSSAASGVNGKIIQQRYGTETAAYFSHQWHATAALNLLYGVRFSWFSLLGPGLINTYNAGGVVTNQANYSNNTLIKQYFNPEPRASLSYTINGNNSVKASYNRNTQNIHLITNSTSASPTDMYVMSSNNIKPGIADQLALGYFKNISNNLYEFSAEAYYKWMQNQIDYKNGAQLIGNSDVESQLIYGKGRAYGIEVFLKKKSGRLNGWLGYTLSKTENQFNGVNEGRFFAARHDRTHDVSAVGIYQLSKRWVLSATFVYGTGNAVTYPRGKYKIGGVTTFYYPERNTDRMPAYHRLDIGATLDGRTHKRFHSSWTFGLFNAYNHKNAYTITFDDNKNDPTRTDAIKTSLFGIIPSVTYNFKF